jgi:hypothetical protein
LFLANVWSHISHLIACWLADLNPFRLLSFLAIVLLWIWIYTTTPFKNIPNIKMCSFIFISLIILAYYELIYFINVILYSFGAMSLLLTKFTPD